MSDKLDLLQKFYDRVWVSGAVEEASGFFGISTEASGLLPDLAVGAREFHEFVAALLEMVELSQIKIEKAVEQGDWLAVVATYDATVRATRQRITGNGMVMVQIENGRFVEAYNCIDFLGLFEKVGLVPENALALCMAGQRLR
ncbi:ester cyclase [Tropicimonas sp.]|uniref:ester cyclase n=1 Tax=Tropicimonas sp. TaxID=2067044 RepID=UPI003A842FBA